MKAIYDRFADLLRREDKAGAVRYALAILGSGEIGVADLYENILGPLLNYYHCPENDESCIWREHVRTSIVRAVVEVCYPYVLQTKDSPSYKATGNTVLVVCPTEEYHEIGARMASDFFELAGFDVKYVGANTPNRDILAAVRQVQPDIVAVSVTNYYNLVKAKTMVEGILQTKPGTRIVLGGHAFRDPAHVASVGAGEAIQSFARIQELAAEVRR